jgi:hypothetical protein
MFSQGVDIAGNPVYKVSALTLDRTTAAARNYSECVETGEVTFG